MVSRFGGKPDLRSLGLRQNPESLGFGIRTPVATEGTAFKENHGPDTRTIVDTEFLDIKNGPLNRHDSNIPPIYKISN
jgi:hypothetical protein